MNHQPPVGPGRPGPGVAAGERTRPVRVLPAPGDPRPTRLIGNFVVPPPAEAPSTPTEAPSPADAPAVAGPATTLIPALPPVGGARAKAVPPGPAAAPAEPPVVADQPTDALPAGSGRPADAATVSWLAGPGPDPRPYPRVVPRRHPLRALLLVVLLVLAVAAVVWAVALS